MDVKRRERRRGGSKITEYDGVIANAMDEEQVGKYKEGVRGKGQI